MTGSAVAGFVVAGTVVASAGTASSAGFVDAWLMCQVQLKEAVAGRELLSKAYEQEVGALIVSHCSCSFLSP